MPSRQSVEAFVAQVVAGDHVGRDPRLVPRRRLDAGEPGPAAPGRPRGADGAGGGGDGARREASRPSWSGGPLIDGDPVAIRWRFTFDFKDGGRMRQEEIAWQTWRGDKIAEETFFYDPAQRRG